MYNGDIISLSSDEEVTLVINSLPSDGIWRVLARVRPSQSSKPTHRPLFGEPLFHLSPLLSLSSLLGGGVRSSLWDGLDSVVSEALKEREELIANVTKETKKAQEIKHTLVTPFFVNIIVIMMIILHYVCCMYECIRSAVIFNCSFHILRYNSDVVEAVSTILSRTIHI